MTRERALELARDLDLPCVCVVNCQCRPAIADAILAVVAEEREACAKIAERHVGHDLDAVNHATTGKADCAEAITQQIRWRGIPLKVGA